MGEFFLRILIILPIAVGCVVVLGSDFLRWYLHFKRETATFLSILLSSAAVGIAVYRTSSDRWIGFDFYGTVILTICGVVLALKLYRAWTGIDSTEAERMPGSVGVRAWLSPTNLALAGLITVSAHYAFGRPLLGIGAFVIALLLVFPAINSLLESEREGVDASTSDRAKVLEMLAAGKISVSESVELLNALAGPDRSGRIRSAVSGDSRFMLVGAALVLIGFFLPWFTVNPSEELARLGKSAGMTVSSGAIFSERSPNFPTVNVSGGDVGQGLGWIVLGLGLAAACHPFVAEEVSPRTQKKLTLVLLGGGGIVLLFLVSNNYHYLNAGILIVMAGYLLEFAGAVSRPGAAVSKTS